MVSLGLQSFFEGQEVLDNAVMDNDNVSATISVGMGVFLRRSPVSRPPRMTKSPRSLQRVEAECLFEPTEFSLGATDVETALWCDDSQTGRVISPVFQPA
jgi:hypothetical protein